MEYQKFTAGWLALGNELYRTNCCEPKKHNSGQNALQVELEGKRPRLPAMTPVVGDSLTRACERGRGRSTVRPPRDTGVSLCAVVGFLDYQTVKNSYRPNRVAN